MGSSYGLAVWILVGGSAALLAVGLRLAMPALLALIDWRTRVARAVPIPASWRAVVERDLPGVAALDRPRVTRVLQRARELIATCTWQGCDGLVLTDEMKVVIAAQACVLTLERPGDAYARVRSILVYPRTFVPRPFTDVRKWVCATVNRAVVPELGEAWSSGTVVLSWDAVAADAAAPTDGHNVVYHEFAHALAFEHHLTFDLEDASDTAPRVRAAVRDPETWRAVLSESLDKLCDALERGEPTALDSYGANNQAEFFAVATETFFERPRDVRAAFPHLYDQFCGFYRQDPAQWVPRPEPTGPRDATQPKSP